MDVVLDPEFRTNGYLYVYYCRNGAEGPNGAAALSCRVSRFTHDPATLTADAATEQVPGRASLSFPLITSLFAAPPHSHAPTTVFLPSHVH